MKSLHWVVKELRHQGLQSFLTVCLLALAYTGLGLALAFQAAIESFLSEKSREILGADYTISSSQPFDSAEEKDFEGRLSVKKKSETIEFLANLRTDSTTTLAEVFAVDSSYPLIGKVTTKAARSLQDSLGANGLVLDQEIQQWLKVDSGETVRIGSLETRVEDFLLEDSSLGRSTVVIAPRTYLAIDQAEKTGLLQFGAQVTYRRLYLLNNDLSLVEQEELQKLAEQRGWSAQNPRQVLQGIERSLKALSLYLNWLSLLIVFLGFLMGFYLIQIMLRQAGPRIGILTLLGLPIIKVKWLYLQAIFFLQMLSVGLALLFLATVFKFAANPWLATLAIQLELNLGPSVLAWLLAASLSSSLLFFWPYLGRAEKLNPQVLLENSSAFIPQSRSNLRSSVAMIFLFFGLTGAALKDLQFSGLWLLGFAFLLTTYWAATRWLFPLLARATRLPWLRIVFLQLSQMRFASLLLFVALAQVSFSLVLTPSLKVATLNQLGATQSNEDNPDLFALNIQPEELDTFRSDLKKRGLDFRHPSPLLLGRLLTKNGLPLNQSRLTKKPVRLSYRGDLLSSEKVVAGLTDLPVQDPSEELGLLSLEEDFAERFGFQLNDLLELDIGGIELKAKVVQIRQVQWQTFQPNFFMQFADGWLNQFPKTFIGIVYGLDPATRSRVQAELIEDFPNLTLIDLSRSIEKIAKLTQGLIRPIERASWVQSLFVWLVAVGILFFYLSSRRNEMALLGWLNAPRFWVFRMFFFENLLLACFSWMISALLAGGASYFIVTQQFKVAFVFNWSTYAISFLSVVGAVSLTSLFITWWAQKKRGQERELLAS